ncbi:MAG: cell division protein ZipA C-terminal FtsZ-binding domain-containing protein [Steroidobacterales bacterium]
MVALRWILLLAGLVFLAGLAVWEQRRPRQARRDGALRSERNEPAIGAMEPTSPNAEQPLATRARTAPPPRIDLPPLEPLEAADARESQPAEQPGALIDEPIEALGPPPEGGIGAGAPLTGVFAGTRSGARGSAAEPAAANGSALPLEALQPAVVDWPPESERHIISLRIAALSHERLSGRVVRQALGACGFEHGRFGIFHQPGADGRALLSAANLSKPGIFDLPNMDFQRFAGLSVFAVLPGPLPPAAALDHLLDTAQDLAERLRARLQDEQGLTLGAEQLETLRRTVQDLTAATERAEPTA